LGTVERRVGRLLGANSRASGLFKVDVRTKENGSAAVDWGKIEAWRQWAQLSEGCYLLRSNINNWSGEQLWETYIQLTEAEAAFRIHKGDLRIRPIWHQKEERVQGHILVCFLAYVLWKTMAQICKKAGLGDEPRKVFDEISQLKLVEVIFPTRAGIEIHKNCISQPTKYQAILLDKLGLTLPQRLEIHEM